MKTYLIKANITGCKKWHLVVDKNPGMYFVQEDFEEENFEIEAYREEFPNNEVIDLKEELGHLLGELSSIGQVDDTLDGITCDMVFVRLKRIIDAL